MIKKLQNILKSEEEAKYYVSTPRTGCLVVRTFKQFSETFDKKEATKMEAERISPSETSVKIWIRGYSGNSYMIETARDNVLIDIPQA